MPTLFDGLTLGRGGPEDLAGFDGILKQDHKVFVLEGNAGKFAIAAAGCKVLKNDLDIFESSLEGFTVTDDGRDLGTVLALG